MSVSFSKCAMEYETALLDFIWRQWCALGVAGTGSSHVAWPIDPEPLLPLSLEVSRHDPRVFDEIIDWLIRNGEWINVQRLCSIIRADCPDSLPLVRAVAAVITERRQDSRWRSLDNSKSETSPDAEPLFEIDGRPWDPGEKTDPVFLRHGFRRSPVSPRGLSHEVPMAGPHCLCFKMRSLFGVNVRADVLGHLVARGKGHASEISRLLGFSQKQVQETLVEAASSGLLQVRQEGRRKVYRLELERWRTFLLGRDCPTVEWVNWRALTRGLNTLWRGMREAPEKTFSDYVGSSVARRAMRNAREDLLASRIGLSLEDDRPYRGVDYLEVFIGDIRRIAARIVPD